MKKTLALGLALSCLTFVFTACAKDRPAQNDKAQANKAPAAATQAVSKEAPKLTPREELDQAAQKQHVNPRFVIANADLSNLQLDDPTIPVYDLLSVQERRAKGLPTQLPKITPYTKGKVAYLTFDDGPDDKNTDAVMDILKQENVKATFYVLGSYCYERPQTLLRMFKEGHAIGNHSFSHEYDILYPNVNGFMNEMYATEKVEREILGYRSLIIRAPGGKYDAFTKAYDNALLDAGLVEHDWNVCIDDAVGGHPTADDFVNKVASQTADGKTSAIVLMHSTYGKGETVKALPRIIQLLRERGYTFGVVTPMTPQPY